MTNTLVNAIHTDQIHILLVEDNEDDYLIVRDLLRDIDAKHYVLEWAETYESGLDAVWAQRHDLILLDYRLAGQTGLELLQETQSLSSRAPVILMTGQGDHDIDVHAMQAGAADYLVKDRLEADGLERTIRYAVERQKAAEALQASEDRYRTFVENSTEGIWRFELEQPMPTNHSEDEQLAYLDRYAYVAECNDAMARLYGYEHASDILGARFGEFLWSHEVSDDNYPRRLIRNEYRLVTHETFVIDRHGEPKCVLHNMIGVVENGLLYRLWGSQIDITERQRSENAQAQLAAIVETSDDAIYSKTLDGLIVTWNKAAEALYGYTAQEVTGQPVSMLIPEQRSEQTQRVQASIRRGERVPQFETKHYHKSGKLLDVSLAVSPIITDAGQVTGSSSIVRDISDRKQAEARLRQSETSMAAAQHVAHFGSWEIDLDIRDDVDANPLRWSDETFRIFGYEPHSVPVTNDLFFRAIPPEEHPAIQGAITEAIAQHQSQTYVHRIRRPDGEERIVRETAQFFAGEAMGQPDRLVGTVHDITEQQRAEEQIRFQALLLSQVRNAVIATDLTGRIAYWNNFAETLYQWKAEEVLGKSIMDLMVFPHDRQAGEQIWREIQDTGHWEGEFPVRRKDGSVFPAYVADTLLRDAHGAPTGFVGVSIDITERKQAEEARYQREQEFETLVENAPDIVSRYDRQFRHLYVNRVITQVTGLPASAFLGKTHAELGMPLHLQAAWRALLEEVFTSGMEQDTEFEFQTPGGTRYYHSRLVPERAPDGSIRSVLNVSRDITERKQAEETLRASEARFRTIIQNSWDVFHLRDQNGLITYESPAVTRVLGYQPEEMVGHNALEFVHPDDASRLLKTASSQSAAPDGFRTLVLRVRHKDGSWRWIESFEVNLLDNPDVGAFAVNYRDITERKQAEDALRTSEQRLRLTLDSGRFGTFRLDLTTGRYLEISDLSRTQFALSSEDDVFLSDFFERVHPNDRDEMQAVVARASATQDVDFSSDYRIVLPDGSIRWISVHGALTYDDAGLPARMLGVTQDITERKQAEEALRQQNALIRIASKVTHTGGWAVEMPGRRVFWSEELCDILEYPHGSVLPLEEALAIHPVPWRDEITAAIGACAQDGLPFDMEIKILTRRGREIWGRVCGEAERHTDGVITRVQGAFQDITANVLMVEALRRSEHEFRRIVETTHEGVLQMDADAKITYVNHRYCEMLGYTAEELLGRSPFDLMEEESRSLAQESFEKRRQGVTEQFDRRFRHKDGSVVWGLVSASPLFDDEGRMIGSLSMTTDITERKRVEKERDRFFTLSLDMLCIAGVNGYFKRLNPAWEKTLGFSTAELLATPVIEFVHPEDRAATIASRATLSQGDLMPDFENRYRCRDGSYRWLRWNVAHDQETGLMYGVAHDITERKQAEDALRQSETRFRSVVEKVESLVIHDAQGRLIDVNQNACESLGYTREELLQLRVQDYELKYEQANVALLWEQMASGEIDTLIVDGLHQRKDGSTFPVEVRVGLMEMEGSTLMVAVARDVTDRKQAEAALQRAKDDLETRVQARTQALQWAVEEAERANAAKSEFLSRMSHELRTPMNSILGFAQLMEMDAPEGKQAVRLGHIVNAGQHLLQLINEVLDLARVESGRLQLSSETVSLSVCIQNAVDMIRPLCDRRNQRILCDWSECESLYVRADQQRLTQVLINLLSNATKYNRDDGIILVRCEPAQEGRHRVSISDSGAGISPEQIAKLFQPFERLAADDSAIEGTGLGLALSKRLMELMGGIIRVESVVGTGSTFIVELPLAEPPELGLEAMPTPRITGPDTESRHYDILYIEDNPANLQLIAHILADYPQMILQSAETGLGGLEMARKQPPALILLDLHLPDLPGDEVLARLQANPSTRAIPVLVVSADATANQIRRLLAAGAADYLTKPLDVRLFTDLLHKLLQSPQEKKD